MHMHLYMYCTLCSIEIHVYMQSMGGRNDEITFVVAKASSLNIPRVHLHLYVHVRHICLVLKYM